MFTGATSKGFPQTLTRLVAVDQAAALVARPRVLTQTSVIYGPPIETGRFRSGRLARRAGPARMFEQGAAVVAARAPAILAPALLKGPEATRSGLTELDRLATTATRGFTPRRSGELQESVAPPTGGR